jgi:hypothetical protein
MCRRITLAVLIPLFLIVAVMFVLGFADATASLEDAKRCAPTIWQLQWPKYTGCTMAAHENLAGGLIAAAGALSLTPASKTRSGPSRMLESFNGRMKMNIGADSNQRRKGLP